MADKVASKTETERQINLSVLRKHDNDIDQIIDTAVSVAQYKFNASSGVWEKTEVEGSLFLYSRTVAPYVIIFIMNRLNKQNTKLVLTSDMEFKVQEPFLLCKASNNEIIGIWFYDEVECKTFGALLSRLAVIAKDESSLKIAVLVETQKRQKKEQGAVKKDDGILGMFSRAQEEFQKSREKQTQSKGKQKNSSQLHHGGGKENSQKSFENNSKQEKLQRNGSKPLTPKSIRKQELKRKQEEYQERHANEQEALMNILHGGRRKPLPRSRTMSSTDETSTDGQHNREGCDLHQFQSRAGDLAVFDKLGIIQETSSRHHGSYSKEKVIDCAALESSLLDGEKEELALPLHTVRSMPEFRVKDDRRTDNDEKPPPSNTLPIPFTNTPSTVNLLSPTVIAAKSSRGRGTSLDVSGSQKNIVIGANFNVGTPTNRTAKKLFSDDEKLETKFPDAPTNNSLGSLMSPAAFLSKSTTTKSDNESELTKEEFQEALIYMIKNDAQFMNSLHAAYVEVRKKR